MAQTIPLVGYGRLANSKIWNSIGWLGVIACILIMGYYVMIIAWILIYCYESISGHLVGLETNDLKLHFDQVVADLPTIIMVIFGIMLSAILILRKGLQAVIQAGFRNTRCGMQNDTLGSTALIKQPSLPKNELKNEKYLRNFDHRRRDIWDYSSR